MNRAERRKAAMKVVTNHLKNRQAQKAVTAQEKQKGIGLVFTTHMIALIFWRWSWVPYDRRARA